MIYSFTPRAKMDCESRDRSAKFSSSINSQGQQADQTAEVLFPLLRQVLNMMRNYDREV
jgi:hypothetical protein